MAQDGRALDVKHLALISLGAAVFAVQAKQARDAYVEEVSSGNKPIEGVGTAFAAFVGLAPGRDPKRWAPMSLGMAVFAVRAKAARDVYVEEVSSGNKPIEGVGTAVAAFVGLLPSGPINR